MGRFFLRKYFGRAAYKKIKIEDGIDVEILINLGLVNFNWHGPDNPTTLKDES